jgi:hypothetical protein
MSPDFNCVGENVYTRGVRADDVAGRDATKITAPAIKTNDRAIARIT